MLFFWGASFVFGRPLAETALYKKAARKNQLFVAMWDLAFGEEVK